jgi:hypothetical protein
MAESTSERSPRTASMSCRRDIRYRRYTRLALRGLAIAGFAGAAWLLSSSVAHASAPAHHGGAGPAGLAGLLGNPGGDPHQEGSGTVLTTATGALAHTLPASGGRRSTTTRAAGPHRAGSGDLVGGAVRGLLGSPVHQPAGSVLAPVLRAADVVTAANAATATHAVAAGRPGNAASTAKTTTVGRPGGATAGTATSAPAWKRTRSAASAGHTRSPHAQPAALHAGTGNRAAVTAAPVASSTTIPVDAGSDGAALQREVGSRHRAGGGDHPLVGRDPIESRRTHHVPLRPRPAPAPPFPGAGLTTGATGTGSGLNQDDGAPAIVPVAMAAVPAAENRPDRADDVEVRTLIAESPTISPD